jgi:energy-converting hydrogenase Eha subunit E
MAEILCSCAFGAGVAVMTIVLVRAVVTRIPWRFR